MRVVVLGRGGEANGDLCGQQLVDERQGSGLDATTERSK